MMKTLGRTADGLTHSQPELGEYGIFDFGNADQIAGIFGGYSQQGDQAA